MNNIKYHLSATTKCTSMSGGNAKKGCWISQHQNAPNN
mgnify:CR=1 FL=1